jgi:putative ABC transport system permease protein
MLKNYFLVALRHLAKHKLYSLLNTFCLVIGITFALLIGTYIINEKSVNSSLKNVADQYVLKSKWKVANMGRDFTAFGPLAKSLKEEYPHLIENYYRFDAASSIVSVDDNHFRAGIAIGDTSFVSMYGFELLYGDPDRPFPNNQSVVITESFADKLFGTKDVVGKDISIQTQTFQGKSIDFTVSAVLREPPYNNSITNFSRPYEVFLPMDNNQYFQKDDKGDDWNNLYMVNMVQLKKGVTPADVKEPLEKLLVKYQPAQTRGNVEIQLDSIETYYLLKNNGAVQKMIITLLIIAAFILLMTIINFVNIHIGTSVYRLKEIGLRKVFGGERLQLVVQHLVESFLLSCIGIILSITLYELLHPLFGQLLNTKLTPVWQFGLSHWMFLFALLILMSFLSGVYPGIVLSSINIIQAAKGKISSGGGKTYLRRALLVVQFTIAVVTCICALTFSSQVSYFFNKDLGFDKDQVMVVSSVPRQWDSLGVVKMESLKTEMLQSKNVKAATLSFYIPDGNTLTSINILREGNDQDVTSMLLMGGDEDYDDVYGLTMVEGVFLKDDNSSSTEGKIVLNESAVKQLGWTSAVGKTIQAQAGQNRYLLTVVGVVKDFHYASMQANIQPLVFAHNNEPYIRFYRYYSFKIGTPVMADAIDEMKTKWSNLFPESGFEYTFMDDRFQSLYSTELQLKKAANIATVLMVIIVLLGIVGIVTFTLTNRTKEIAIRKVLGAKTTNIVGLFTKEYVLQIVVSIVLGCPLAFAIADYWLQGYAYRIQQGVLPFLLTAAFLLTTALTLIFVLCFRTAAAAPVKDLRSE